MNDTIRPECKQAIQETKEDIKDIKEDIKDIHEVIYKNGLVTQVRINSEKIERVIKNLEKAIWLITALIIGFLGDFIWGLLQGP